MKDTIMCVCFPICSLNFNILTTFQLNFISIFHLASIFKELHGIVLDITVSFYNASIVRQGGKARYIRKL